MLLVEGKKMSKSLGNFFTVRDLLEQGVPGEVIRFVLLSTHYRSPMDWTDRKRAEAEATLKMWRRDSEAVTEGDIPDRVLTALTDDLNVAAVMEELHKLHQMGAFSELKASCQLLGLLTDEISNWHWPRVEGMEGPVVVTGDQRSSAYVSIALELGERWKSLRDARDFSSADQLRLAAEKQGVALRAIKGGVVVDIEHVQEFSLLESLK
jgi:cysteinyl-tRNA synthetase